MRLGLARLTVMVVAAIWLTGCTTRRPAPVSERTPPPVVAAKPAPTLKVKPKPAPTVVATQQQTYMVRQGDTLYSIALDHGLDYRELAAWNGITNVGVIRAGQQLRLTPPGGTVSAPLQSPPAMADARPLGSPAAPAVGDKVRTGPKGIRLPYSEQAYAQLDKIDAAPVVKPDGGPVPKPEAGVVAKPEPRSDPGRPEDEMQWIWPSTGRVTGAFNGSSVKGIDITGKMGQPVVASAAGRVIFAGTGIRGMGRFIVIRHNSTYISVYAHNSNLLVKQDQTVSRGQVIAEMGNSDADQVKLHFQIRRMGNPVDPARLLPDRPS